MRMSGTIAKKDIEKMTGTATVTTPPSSDDEADVRH